MTRLLVIAAIISVALMVFAFVDAIFFDRLRVRGVPKPAWLVIIVVVPIVGAVLWFLVGRGPRGAGGSNGRRHRGPVAPDDNPEFLRNLNIKKPKDETDKS